MLIEGLTGPQRTRRWIGRIASAGLLTFVHMADAQTITSYSGIIVGASADRSDLRESMRREHRERLDQTNVGERRDKENAARRDRWQRMSPEEREQMRRDIHQAGRAVYPQSPPREGP